MSNNLRVLVVGASIAGPTAAYWFARAGAQVTIIERFPHLRKGGHNVDLRTSGLTVMRRMSGMEPAVRAVLHDMEGLSFVRDDGSPFAVMRATGDPNAQSVVSDYEIFRGDLAQVLYDLTKDDDRITYVFGEQVRAIQQHQGRAQATVEFANGLPAAEFDLVVACDGATSRTRAIGLGCGVRDHMVPLNSWAAFFTIGEDLLRGGKVGKAYSTVGGRFVAIGPDPAGGSKVGFMGIKPRDGTDATLAFREAAKKGEGALKAYMAERFRGAGWKADVVVDGMMKAEDFYASELVQVKAPTLSNGRFVLVGDAGYAPGPTGCGTSLALTGAYVLAGEINRHKGDVDAGLRAYEERMRPIIEDMQKIPPGVPGIMAPQTAWGIWVRNTLFMVVAWAMKFKRVFAWASRSFASSFGGDKYNLPEYEWQSLWQN
ncbi:FAD/NAD(P)-binding domain-containing protein [Cryphonectria parasitica EP155]|uniref:FAD/NAD(P)-binding domain-containing protein n=1 Tax=Cryphonectria parasitica (strain ATCC 38755 / EP155) TaxID=660469 RepID=A0A9P4XS43_CRYP1|nr:FAD/NAD(P)-binding domain-containing protein [Cryphonectria parasitica EP155]KAF3759961.1 FAD/NAD(P)-binding domain-containing protein [Cryphonectria parasitica EP155]